MQGKERVTFEQIQEVFDSFMLLKDRNIVRLTLAAIIGNQIPNRKPIWLLLVAPPSSGKTTVLNALIGLEVMGKNGEKITPIHSISDITDKTFASGMMRNDKEASLLYRIPPGGVLVFKDFTTLVSKREEERRMVFGQLREIYDGSYRKMFGTGEEVNWTGKIGAVGGVTEAIYKHLEGLSVMGDRFVLYQIPQPNRKDALRYALDQEEKGITEESMMPVARDLVQRYMQQAYDALREQPVILSPELKTEIIDVADFCTMVRSGVITNEYTSEIQFVPSPEMPFRMFHQMLALGSTFLLMQRNDNPDKEPELTDNERGLIYKMAYDSIPVTRRMALMHLAKYSQGVDTAALAMRMNYPTKVVLGWLETLNVLGVVKRVKKAGGFGNMWALKDEYRILMLKLQGVRATEDWLIEGDVEEDEADAEWNKDKANESAMITEEELDNMDGDF